MGDVLRFVEHLGTTYRILKEEPDGGIWLIDCDKPSAPFLIFDLDGFKRVQTPECWLKKRKPSKAQKIRQDVIQPLIDDENCITDKSLRIKISDMIANKQGTTRRRVLRLFYMFLATGELTAPKNRIKNKKNTVFDKAIQKYYFSSKRMSLKNAFELMLLENFTSENGELQDNAPSWSQFHNYFYRLGFDKNPQKIISRQGLTKYQRDYRPVWGSGTKWKSAGCYQMDATQADIYLVSRLDRSTVIGRPYIYLAVDIATQLIAGYYVGFSCDETAVMSCIEQAACDKVSFCARHGIVIDVNKWPNTGIPSEIITDKGREFFGQRMAAICRRYGVVVETLPPFRPDYKGIVEKCFDLLQAQWKPILRGKGVIEEDAAERWSTDYRLQSKLNLDEFEAILIHSILAINNARMVNNKTPAQHWIHLSPTLLDVKQEELHIQTLPRISAKLTRKGIRVNKIWYAPIDTDGLSIGNEYDVAFDVHAISNSYIILSDRVYKCVLTGESLRFAGSSTQEVEILKVSESAVKKDKQRECLEASILAKKEIINIAKKADARKMVKEK